MTRLATLLLLAVCTAMPVHSAWSDDDPAHGKGAADSLADNDKADGLARLYAEAARKTGTEAAGTHGKQARYGAVEMESRPSPVMSVIRVKRRPDGSIGLSCSLEHTGFHGAGADHVIHPGKRR